MYSHFTVRPASNYSTVLPTQALRSRQLPFKSLGCPCNVWMCQVLKSKKHSFYNPSLPRLIDEALEQRTPPLTQNSVFEKGI